VGSNPSGPAISKKATVSQKSHHIYCGLEPVADCVKTIFNFRKMLALLKNVRNKTLYL
jgi:hypothetical protein